MSPDLTWKKKRQNLKENTALRKKSILRERKKKKEQTMRHLEGECSPITSIRKQDSQQFFIFSNDNTAQDNNNHKPHSSELNPDNIQ